MILVVVSTGHFDPLIQICSELSGQYDFYGQIGSSRITPTFPFIRTASQENLLELMARAELVVSHAGTGMLSMLFRLAKKTIVIPKQIRYGESNDSQVELGKKWASLGLATLCMDVERLPEAIEICRAQQITFSPPPALGKYLATLL